jgi:hypothetical protein
MSLIDVLRAAMQDELEKIAAGHARRGKRPISAHKLLEKDNCMGKTSVMEKLAPAKAKTAGKAEAAQEGMKLFRPASLLLAGAAGGHMVRKANDDRKLGRQIRLQNQQ